MNSWRLDPISVEDNALWARWDDFIASRFTSHAMLESRFVRATMRHFASSELQLMRYGSAQEDLVLMIVESLNRGVIRTFAPGQSQIAPVLADLEMKFDIPEMFSALNRYCLRMDIFNVDPQYLSLDFKPAENVETSVYGVTTNVQCVGDFNDFWSARPKKLRDNIKRYVRRASDEEMNIEFKTIRDPDAVDEALRRYGELESRGWKGRAGTAIHYDNQQGAFYRALLADFAKRDEALVFELCLNGKVVSSRLAIASGSMVTMLKTTFDENYSKYAPGRIALHETMKVLFDLNQYRTIETYTNAQKEQIDWATGRREITNLNIYPNALLHRSVTVSKLLFRRNRIKPNYTVEIYESFSELPKQFLSLWESYGKRSPFFSLDWFRNLYEFVGHDLGSLRVITLASKAEEAYAILPCVERSSTNGKGRELIALANYYSPNFEIIINEAQITRKDAINRLLECLSLRDDWDGITLFPLHDTRDITHVRSACKQYLLPHATFEETINWSQKIDDVEAYRASLPPKLRAILRRKSSKLKRSNSFRYEIVHKSRAAAAAVPDFNKIYLSSWKSGEPYAGFIEGLISLAAKSRQLRLGLLYIDEQPAAGQIWLVNNGTASIYKLAYDDAFKDYSAGTLLTMHLLEHVVQNDNVTVIDYLTGDDAYKADWMSERKIMYRMRIANPRKARGLYRASYDALRLTKSRLQGLVSN